MNAEKELRMKSIHEKTTGTLATGGAFPLLVTVKPMAPTN